MKKIGIIGISNFGYFLARALEKEGVELVAIDLEEDKIEQMKDHVQKALVLDATDKSALRASGIESMDGVVVCLGKIESSILTVLHLRDLQIRKIVAMALSTEHGRILEMIGASEVIFPERDIAARISQKLLNENVIDQIPLTDGYSIIDITPPQSFLGKSIGELNLRQEYGVQVIVVKSLIPDSITVIPDSTYQIKDSDTLVLLGSDKDLTLFKKLR